MNPKYRENMSMRNPKHGADNVFKASDKRQQQRRRRWIFTYRMTVYLLISEQAVVLIAVRKYRLREE